MSSNVLQLVVAQYLRMSHPPGEEHWALVAISPSSPAAHVFQVKGNNDSYTVTTEAIPNIFRSRSLCGGCRVGEIQESNLGWLRDELLKVPVVLLKPEWNCQNWVIDAIRVIKDFPEKVVIDPPFTESGLRAKMRDDRETWEGGDDHYLQRLIPRALQRAGI